MRKTVVGIMAGILILTASGCAHQNSTKAKVHHPKSAKIVKKHQNSKKIKKNKKKETKKSTSKQKATAQQTNTQQNQQGQRQLTQGEINMQRGYDPNGNPLLPGQDHAAGSNPDGTPDPWVQGQIDWAKRNGLMNPDGSPTEKEKQLERQAENDSYDPDPTSDDTDY